MAHESDASETRIRGEAAWKAALNATEQRNAEARRRAHVHQRSALHASAERERRMAQVESAQLADLNLKLAARGGEHS
jgi:hypothetical protein